MAPWRAGPAPLMSLAHFVLEASFNFLPVTYVLLIPKLGLSYESVGALVFLTAILGSGTQPLFGWLSDRGDPRRIVLVSLIWSGVLMGLVGFMPTYGALAALLGLASLGSAAFHPPAARSLRRLRRQTAAARCRFFPSAATSARLSARRWSVWRWVRSASRRRRSSSP